MAERQTLFDAIFIRRMHARRSGQTAAALGILRLQKMPFARPGTQHLATRCDLKTLRDGLFGFDAFWTTHKSVKLLQKSA